MGDANILVACGYESPGVGSGGDIPAPGSAIGRDSAKTGRFGYAYRNQAGVNHSFDVRGTDTIGMQILYIRWRMRKRTNTGGDADFLTIGRPNPGGSGSVLATINGSDELALYHLPAAGWASRVELSTYFPTYSRLTLVNDHWYQCLLWWEWGVNVCLNGAVSCLPGEFLPRAYLALLDEDDSYSLQGWSGTVTSFPAAWYGTCPGPGTPCYPAPAYSDSVLFGQSNIAGTGPNGLELDLDTDSVEGLIGDETVSGHGWLMSPSATVSGGAALPRLFSPTRIPLNSTTSQGGWVINGTAALTSHLALNDVVPANAAAGCLTTASSGDSFEVSIGRPVDRGYNSTVLGVIVSLYWPTPPNALITVELGVDGVYYPKTANLGGSAGWMRFSWPTVGGAGAAEFASIVNTATITVRVTRNAAATTVRVQNLNIQLVSATDYTPAASTSLTVTVSTGVYTGNGTRQSVETGSQIHWLHVDPVTNGLGTGAAFWDAMLGPSDWARAGQRTNTISVPDPNGTTFEVVGNDASSNQSGELYRWFAIQDGTARCLFRGAFSDYSAGNVLIASGLGIVPSSFQTVRAVWGHIDALQAIGGLNGGYYRGSGMGGTDTSPLSASAVVATAFRTFPTSGGSWTAGSAFTTAGRAQVTYTAWGDTFGGGTILWDVTSYTGNGAATQTIALSLGGKGAGWVMVVPGNANERMLRHASLPANTSQRLSDGNYSTQGIRQLCNDQMVVGSDLNTAGVVYQVLAIVDPNWNSAGTGDCGAGNGSSPTITPTDPPGLGAALSDTLPDPGCIVTFGAGSDSSGGAGCQPTLSGGSDSGGGSGCGVSL